MAYPEQRYSAFETAKDLPTYSAESTDKILARQSDGRVGYILVSDLQTTLDGDGLATDTDISASNAARVSLSGSIATKMANTGFTYVTGSASDNWNDASASAAGIPVGGLYHSQGAVKVRLS
jgi:hypothetical protein